MAEIRSQAVTALQRLQDPRDEECPIIKVLVVVVVGVVVVVVQALPRQW